MIVSRRIPNDKQDVSERATDRRKKATGQRQWPYSLRAVYREGPKPPHSCSMQVESGALNPVGQ